MKTILEYNIVEQQMLDMGMNKDLIIKVMINEKSKPHKLAVFPDPECREQGKPFELDLGYDHLEYYSWTEVQAMQLHSIFERAHDVSDLLDRLDEEADIMNNVEENAKEAFIEVYQPTDNWSARLMTWNGESGRFVEQERGVIMHTDKFGAIQGAISWGQSDNVKVVDGTEILFTPKS